MFDSPVVRRSVILAAPLLMIVFSLVHGLDWVLMHGMHDDYEAFLEYIVQIRARWLAVHVAGLVLFPLLGVAIWWMLPPDRWATRISQVGLAGYIVLYSAFDAIAGIGSAVLAESRTPARARRSGVLRKPLSTVRCDRRRSAHDRRLAVPVPDPACSADERKPDARA